MPATESTWYNIPLLHRIFAVSAVVLALSTVWMFYKDHFRPWKKYQQKTVQIDVAVTQMRQEQFETDQARAEVARLEIAASEARALPIDVALVDAFAAELQKEKRTLPDQAAKLQSLKEKSEQAAAARKKATEARQAAEADLSNAELQRAAVAAERDAAAQEQAAAKIRSEIVAVLQKEVDQAQINENKTLGERKFQSAFLDKSKADLDIGIRDSVPAEKMAALQAKVDDDKKKLDALTARYQELSAHRIQLQKILQEITAPVAAAEKALEDSLAAKRRLETTIREKRETYFTGNWLPIFPGKKFLNAPIIDAFMGRRRPENLWSQDLVQDYNFSKVRRFDRCTTCHGSMQKSLPGDPTSPAYLHEVRFDVVVTPRTADEIRAIRAELKKPEVDAAGEPIPFTLEEYLGLKLADHGLLNDDDVIVKYVEPRSPGAAAQPVDPADNGKLPTGEEIQQQLATGITPPAKSLVPERAGFLVGDVISAIDGSELFGQYRGAARAAATLVDLAAAGKPFRVTVLRGLPHPYSTHPRLDLYVSDSSPHKMSTFACTICHEGQGSATEFKWASHSPNTQTQAYEWATDPNLKWFNNHHWIYPMYPARFMEATCLKCHHDVVELEPSDKFPDAPAPKLMHGYHLIRKYGCYGCHEVNGFDGPTKRVGPDLRLEPNFFAVAQQFTWEAGQAAQGAQPNGRLAEMLSLARTLAERPEDNAVRNRLRMLIEEDQLADEKVLPADTYRLAGMLKDVEAPGSLRKPGPSLRFIKHKVQSDFLYDWIWNPQNFRPSTRMPQFFGLWDHLADEESLKVAHNLEPIEARGLVKFLEDRSQDFEPIKRPAGVDEWTDEEMIERGKLLFETRGCLACHTHKDFPETGRFRGSHEIVQGPDLSNIGRKFAYIPEDKESGQKEDRRGPEWLYSWIKNPQKYHARSVMPNLFLEPEKDANGKVYDPAEDITTYLLSDNQGEWKPVLSKKQLNTLTEAEQQALKDLVVEYMNEAFFQNDVLSPDGKSGYYYTGLPESMRADLKGAETELITANGQLTDEQRLRYIGLKTVSKYGCFGCHDIPGFEDAKPIGTQLQNWGRKDPTRLAFEHIAHYPKAVGHKHGGAHGAAHGEAAHSSASKSEAVSGGAGSDHVSHGAAGHDNHEELPEGFEGYYADQLHQGSRIGFIYQKLLEPRSYDYNKTANKRFNERLRMPQFPFNAEEREAVITFVLGLVAEPPREKYLYRPDPRAKAIAEGKIVLEKYNCGACHILEADRWKLSFTPGTFEPQAMPDPPIFPFLQAHFPTSEVTKSATPDASNRLHALIAGIPKTTKAEGLPELVTLDDEELVPEDPYDPRDIKLSVDLVQPALIDGSVHQAGLSKVSVPGSTIASAYTGNGGMLTRYLLPRVTSIAQETNANASGTEAYGWLPPPLFGEGKKVQSNWLYEFLLDPYPIRPAVFLRMPKFNMSPDEATKLVNYFAAVDNAAYPYDAAPMRKNDHLAELQAKYAEKANGRNRLDDAMKIVMDRKNFCAQCHQIADFDPGGSPRAKGPNLADVYRRLRPDYLRDWIANPKMILPYTGMPINIPYNPDPNELGKASAHYHGNSEEQVQALVDLLMNYDQYAKEKNAIAPQIPSTEEAPANPPAETSEAGTGN
jgi:cytochrome c551/c552